MLNDDLRSRLNLCFSAEEIKRAMRSILDSKAPGLDIVNAIQQFFVGDDIVNAI